LRESTFGHARQMGAAARKFLINLAGIPLLPGAEAVTYVDADSLLRRVYGKAKQAAGFGHTKVGGTTCCCAGSRRWSQPCPPRWQRR